MKYLEDTLAEQCLSKTLYPGTKIIVSRKKVEGTLLTYTNELEVNVDFSDVDPSLLENVTTNENKSVSVLGESSGDDDANFSNQDEKSESSSQLVNQESSNSSGGGKASRFFRKKN